MGRAWQDADLTHLVPTGGLRSGGFHSRRTGVAESCGWVPGPWCQHGGWAELSPRVPAPPLSQLCLSLSTLTPPDHCHQARNRRCASICSQVGFTPQSRCPGAGRPSVSRPSITVSVKKRLTQALLNLLGEQDSDMGWRWDRVARPRCRGLDTAGPKQGAVEDTEEGKARTLTLLPICPSPKSTSVVGTGPPDAGLRPVPALRLFQAGAV